MVNNKMVLLTVFRGTSAELLVKNVEHQEKYKILLLPNDKEKDAELLIEALQQEHFDYIISLGQRPNMKDKVHIETTAKKGEASIETAFDCKELQLALEQKGLEAKLSHNAGTSFCNELYWNGLRYLAENKPDTKMVFVHVPFEKNFSEIEDFCKKIFDSIEALMR